MHKSINLRGILVPAAYMVPFYRFQIQHFAPWMQPNK